MTTAPNFSFGDPVPLPKLFTEAGPQSPKAIDITPDGKRFIGVARAEQIQAAGGGTAAPPVQVVLNWSEELKQKVPNK